MSEPGSSAPPWHAAHQAACARGDDTYIDPRTGYQVFTRIGLEARGDCCGAGCRHCPYGHSNVDPKSRAARISQPAYLHGVAPRPGPVDVVFWSGGKDSLLALRAWLHDGPPEDQSRARSRDRIVLLTSFDARSRNIAHQEIPIQSVQRQAAALDLPLLGMPLHPGVDYVETVRTALANVGGAEGVEHLVFGDLHLAHIRQWREQSLSVLGPKLAFPLWQRDYDDLLEDLRASAVPCELSACPAQQKGEPTPLRVGDMFDATLAARAREAGWDAFGENGEFHTLAKCWEAKHDPLRRRSASTRSPLSS